MKNTFVKTLLAAAVLGCGLSSVSAAVVYDAKEDFSVSNGNPNDTWSYGWMDAGFATYTPYTQTRTTASDPAWYNSGIDSWIWLNETGSTAYGVPDGWLTLSPGNGGQAPILRWTVPDDISGLVQITGEFLPGDLASMSLAIFEGTTKTPENTLWSGTDSGSFDFTVNVAPGDIINFTIFGTYSFGNTPISATIEAVPEPGTSVLLAISGVSLLVIRRRWRS